MASQGLFLSFEGLDGSGKTTQLSRLADRLRTMGIEPVITQEPGGTLVGQEIRSVLLHSANTSLDATAELLLYFASRAQNLAEVILPALEDGRVVICDRFTDATVAYQGYGRDLGVEMVSQLSNLACSGIDPDLTLWLDTDVEASLERARARNAEKTTDEGRMEAMYSEFFLRVRQGYADLHERFPERIRRIDADGTEEEVGQRVLDAVLPLIQERGLGGR